MDIWQVSDHDAQFQSTRFQAHWRIDRPSDGLYWKDHPVGASKVADESSGLSGTLFGIELPGFESVISNDQIIDHNARQQNLTVTYERHQPDHLRGQLDWRIGERSLDDVDGNSITCWGVQLLVSLTTNRLDARPQLTSCTSFPVDELSTLSANAQPDTSDLPVDDSRWAHPIVLFRPAENESTWVQLVYPTDLVRLQLTSDRRGCQARLELLNEHLEKGVIRRVQLAAWLVPRDIDRILALQLFHRLLVSPPPIASS